MWEIRSSGVEGPVRCGVSHDGLINPKRINGKGVVRLILTFSSVQTFNPFQTSEKVRVRDMRPPSCEMFGMSSLIRHMSNSKGGCTGRGQLDPKNEQTDVEQSFQ